MARGRPAGRAARGAPVGAARGAAPRRRRPPRGGGDRRLNLLAFDTATSATAVALLTPDRDEPLEALDDPGAGARPRHTPQLLTLARRLLDRAGLGLQDLDRIAVGTGPGSFTGLRIGVATARALAQATGAELVGVSTLRALAVAAEPEAEPGATILAVLDARRGEAFAAAWTAAGDQVLEPRALAPEALADLVRERTAGNPPGPVRQRTPGNPPGPVRQRTPASPPPWLGIGDGAVRFVSQLSPAGVTVPAPSSPLHRVSAAVLCRLGAEAEPARRDAVVPDYLRLPDAELRVRSQSR